MGYYIKSIPTPKGEKGELWRDDELLLSWYTKIGSLGLATNIMVAMENSLRNEIDTLKNTNATLAAIIEESQAEIASLKQHVGIEPTTADSFNLEFRHNPDDDPPDYRQVDEGIIKCDTCGKKSVCVMTWYDNGDIVAICDECYSKTDEKTANSLTEVPDFIWDTHMGGDRAAYRSWTWHDWTRSFLNLNSYDLPVSHIVFKKSQEKECTHDLCDAN